MLKTSNRAGNVQPFLVMDMMAQAGRLEANGSDIIHMEVGQPSGGPARKVIEAAQSALMTERLGYVNALGIAPLRQRIARHYRETYNVSISPEQVVVTTGSSAAFLLAFTACFDRGQKVGLATPGYPAYRNILKATDLEVVDIATTAASRWAPTIGDINNRQLDGLLVASPANPTGTMLASHDLEALVIACKSAGVRFISDEIYHELTWDEANMPQATALQFDRDAIVINSFSKYYCMTGWRVGWMVVPESLIRPLECLSQNLYISTPAISQYAALAAFDAREELDQRKAVYAANREFLMTELPAIGIDKFTPVDGAFYIYADVSKFTNDSLDFTNRMVKEAGVATTTGLDFDPTNGNHHIRLSFAGSLVEMQEAVKRLKAWL
ncbi:Valine--pyruvate aminotransferase [hydrothermal vent metagenome]|uniref:Valine--pyruvate aminotransferase n=1 Tax=hydrothermal vent metagenome TaxID=652676 RepID=A0A3B0RHH2_9ZZZZ